VNNEGRVQSFHAVVKPQGDTRPAWKVLRVLGNLLNLSGFDYNSSEEVREEALSGQPEFVSGLDNSTTATYQVATAVSGLERVCEVPIYFADSMVRRAASLQATGDAATPVAAMNGPTLARIGVKEGDSVRVKNGEGQAILSVRLDAGLPDGCVRIPTAHAATVALGAQFAGLVVEKA
jgi:NADH-quinone oxidoreductase subunit G